MTNQELYDLISEFIAKAKINPELPVLENLTGNETVPVWSDEIGKLTQYPITEILASGSVDPTNDVVPRYVFINGVDYESETPVNNQIADIVNSTMVIDKTANEFVIFYSLRIVANTQNSQFLVNIQREYYLFLGNKGVYGLNEAPITSNNLFLISRINDDQQNNQTFDLGEIGTQNIWEYVNNNGTYDINQNTQIVIFTALRNGVEYQYLYTGVIYQSEYLTLQALQDMLEYWVTGKKKPKQ